MAVISVTSDLDVADKFKVLVKEALGVDSAYIRAKDTITSLVADDKDMAAADKARMIAEIIGGVVNNINSAAMSTALQWASQEKDIALKKLELEKQLDILAQDILLKTEQVEQTANAIRLSKVESQRMYGVPTFDPQTDDLSTLTDVGKVYQDELLTVAQTAKMVKDKDLVTQKVIESHAAVHKIVADTYVNYGQYTYNPPTGAGVTAIVPFGTSFGGSLSSTQQQIAVEQAKGYTYNAWANALTGASSMLGTAIAAEYAEFTDQAKPGYKLLQIVLDTATNLSNADSTFDEAQPPAPPP
jgi:hypothetical protein